MLKRFYSLILMSFLLTNCAHHTKTSAEPTAKAPSQTSKQYRQITSFNQVHAEGRINMQLHTGYSKPQLILTGDPRDLAQLQSTVKQNTLYLSLGNGYPRFGEVTVDVRGQFLNQFSYKGAGVVTGDKLHTRSLDLYLANEGTTRLGGTLGIQHLVVNGSGLVRLSGVTSYNLQVSLIGNPKVQMTGMVNLSELDINGNGWFSLYWLKSNALTIRAKESARIQLAGVATKLDVELWDTAQFKGRYLRAERSFVKTHDKSTAEISSVNHQSTLATDASDIYYYNIPNTREDFMAYNGSVLNMREWALYDTQVYTRYNKQFP